MIQDLESQPRVLVVGGGGVGTIAALNLVAGGRARVTMVLRSNYQQVMDTGYTIESVDHGTLTDWQPHEGLSYTAIVVGELGRLTGSEVLQAVPDMTGREDWFRYVVCATKNIQDRRPLMAEVVAPAVTPGKTTVVLIQNGWNIEIPYFRLFPDSMVLSGMSWIGCHEAKSGLIKHTFADKLKIGPFRNPRFSPEDEELIAVDFVSRYGAGGKTDIEYDDNALRSRWMKQLYNASINPLTALLDMNVTLLNASGALLDIARPVVLELQTVGNRLGFHVKDEEVEALLRPDHTGFEPSMLVDREKVW
ncbi:Ketopantoate reductase PanE/ApbA-like protein 3 [Elsinoe fawcettii]|nr:Ketopantoate reductase PanE/ApbA-like protein 3 [Elsinoe fawcettii]